MPSRPAQIATLVAALAVVLGAALVVAPYLSRQRSFTASTPQPAPLTAFALVTVAPGQKACEDRAVVNPQSTEARFRVGSYGQPAQPLLFSIQETQSMQSTQGPPFAETIPVAPAWKDNDTVAVPTNAPPHAIEAIVCIANHGAHPVALYAANDRTHTRSRTTVDGHAVQPNFMLSFYEARPASIWERLATILQRISIFRPLLGPLLLWPLLALVLLGIPALALFALVRAAESDERDQTRLRAPTLSE